MNVAIFHGSYKGFTGSFPVYHFYHGPLIRPLLFEHGPFSRVQNLGPGLLHLMHVIVSQTCWCLLMLNTVLSSSPPLLLLTADTAVAVGRRKQVSTAVSTAESLVGKSTRLPAIIMLVIGSPLRLVV